MQRTVLELGLVIFIFELQGHEAELFPNDGPRRNTIEDHLISVDVDSAVANNLIFHLRICRKPQCELALFGSLLEDNAIRTPCRHFFYRDALLRQSGNEWTYLRDFNEVESLS